jgi:hypothetical protein
MRRIAPALLLVACGAAAMACGLASANSGAVPTGVSATLTSVAAAVPTDTATPEPTPTAAPLPPRLWKSYSSGGPTGWWLENGAATEVTLPVEPGQYYDYNSANGKMLYASHFSTAGAGPGNLAVSDLWMIDYPSGSPVALIPTDSVVEALWAPDGLGFVYIGATPTTYELRYRSLAGDERILASDVSPTWSVAPSGGTVAFTRETGYSLPGAPGLYLVPLDGSGPDVRISSADRHGSGSIDDSPIYSPDEATLALPNSATYPATLVITAADGSRDASLTFSPELTADPVLGSVPSRVLWYPDSQHLLGLSSYAEGMGGPYAIVRYDLGEDRHTVVSAARVGTGFGLIDWNVPGQSAYALIDGNQPSLISLP